MGIFDDVINKVASEAANRIKDNSNRIVDELKDKAKSDIHDAMNQKKKTFKYDHLPESLQELKDMDSSDLTDTYEVAALTVLALNVWAKNKKLGKQMLEYLNGPEAVSESTIQFIADRFMAGKEYVIRSYFAGADDENDYKPKKPYKVTVIDYRDQEEEENYARVYLVSGGADEPREVILRYKPSDDKWYVWEFGDLLADIRIPKSEDIWA